ncbi:MAG: hypothetical protein A4S09_14265 [Proteobacteria bacterium SG_bin7]|nr:MAG: hypothetical protein A4S09_14265 [Proteobacteria bacterium SG_bin7]
MKWNPMTRRHFLQGAGGAMLSLPFLPSLISNRVLAAALSTSQQKSFIGICNYSGLFRMYGPQSLLMPILPHDISNVAGFTRQSQSGKHTVSARPLSTLLTNGKISQIIDTSYNPLLPKMQMIQGMDFLSIFGHHGGHFGNTATSPGVTGLPPVASIDQVMAYSTNFYKNASLKGRSVVYTNTSDYLGLQPGGMDVSSTWADPNNKLSSAIVATPRYKSPAVLWDKFFGTVTPPTNLKKTLVDIVLADYNTVRNSRQIASEDKKVLDNHIALLQQTQQEVTQQTTVVNGGIRPSSKAPSGADWGNGLYLTPQNTAADRIANLRAMNSVITSIIASGLCHSFLGNTYTFTSVNPGDWHAWGHEGYSNDTNTIANQSSYDKVVNENTILYREMALDLALKLDAVSQNGKTLLDNSLLTVVMEHSKRGHEAWNCNVISFGSAGGVLNTGQYLDYRNMASGDDLGYTRHGMPINQLWANYLLACDVPASEFEALNPVNTSCPLFTINGRRTGYGVSYFNTVDGTSIMAKPYPYHQYGNGTQNWNGHDLSGWLPFIKV